MAKRLKTVLILGSAPDVVAASAWEREGLDAIVAINNAWKIRPDWDYLIHPEDFDPQRLPVKFDRSQKIITAQHYVPVQNAYGGFVYAGGTMAFTAGYWTLGALKPRVMAFFGCDMNYESGFTHFYGKGKADPLRDDITLQSLEAKSARLMLMAAAQDCICVNLSRQKGTRLVFPRKDEKWIGSLNADIHAASLAPVRKMALSAQSFSAIRKEAELGYMAESGRYWENAEDFNSEALRQLDSLWLAAAQIRTGP